MTKQTETNEVQTHVSDEEAASLAALNAQVEKEQALTMSAAEPAENVPAVPTLQNELAGLIGMVVTLAGPILPSLTAIYTPETTNAVAGAVSSLCNKYGWLQDGIANGYSEEIAAAMVLLPVGIATYQGVTHDLSAMKATKKKPEPETVAAEEVPQPETEAPTGDGHTPMTGLQLVQTVEGV